MTKIRPPESIEDACRQTAALIGDDAISTALVAIGLRASPSLIAKWSDPDTAQTPSLAQCLAMEKLLIKTGHAPIFTELFMRLQPVHFEPAVEPIEGAMRATIGAAELMKAVRASVQDGRLEVHEVAGLKARLQKLQRELAALNRSLVVKPRK